MRILLNPETVKFYNVDRDSNILKMTQTELKEHARKMLVSFYYESLLFYPDCILLNMKAFLNHPTKENLMLTAVIMKEDLWNKKTKVNLETLSLE